MAAKKRLVGKQAPTPARKPLRGICASQAKSKYDSQLPEGLDPRQRRKLLQALHENDRPKRCGSRKKKCSAPKSTGRVKVHAIRVEQPSGMVKVHAIPVEQPSDQIDQLPIKWEPDLPEEGQQAKRENARAGAAVKSGDAGKWRVKQELSDDEPSFEQLLSQPGVMQLLDAARHFF